MKKLILILAMAAFVITGCQKSEESKNTEPLPTEDVETEETVETEEVGTNEELNETNQETEENSEESESPTLEDGTVTGEFVSLVEEGDKTFVEFSEVEWITYEDTDRIEELGLNPDEDMPNGFYINPVNEGETIKAEVNEDTKFTVVTEDLSSTEEMSFEDFKEYANSKEYILIFDFLIEEGIVTEVTERYIP